MATSLSPWGQCGGAANVEAYGENCTFHTRKPWGLTTWNRWNLLEVWYVIYDLYIVIPLISQKKQLRLITVYIGIQSSDNSVQPSYCCLLGWLSHLIIDHRTRFYSIISSCHPLMGQFNTLSPKNMGTLPILITWWMMRPEKWRLPSINHHSFLSKYTSTVTVNLLPTCTRTNLIVPFYLFLFTTHLHPRIHQPWLHDSSFPYVFNQPPHFPIIFPSFSHHFPIIFPSCSHHFPMKITILQAPDLRPGRHSRNATAASARRWAPLRQAPQRRAAARWCRWEVARPCWARWIQREISAWRLWKIPMVCTLWLCQNSYWKWPFIVDFPIKNGDFP